MQLVTTVLDLLGALALVAGIVLWVAAWSVPAAVFVAGLGLLALAATIDLLPAWRARRAARG